jgi:putative DNA methylase
MITFRLADALPTGLLETLEQTATKPSATQQRHKIEASLDAGYGKCWLRDSRIASLVEETLLHFDTVRYRLLARVVMPNHVHVLVEIHREYSLAEIVHSWKSFSAKGANRILARSGRFWQPEYFDRFIRDAKHFASAVRYIHENPVKARLVNRVEDWPYSSATHGRWSSGLNTEVGCL